MEARLPGLVKKALEKLGPVSDAIVASMNGGDSAKETKRKAILAAMQFLDDFPNEEVSDAVGFACMALLAVYNDMARKSAGPDRHPPSLN